MSDYKDRLLIEQRDLRDKIEKLTGFLSVNSLNPYKKHKLLQQREAMLSYYEILVDRLIDAGVIKSANPERLPKEGVNGFIHGGPGHGEVVFSELETIRIDEPLTLIYHSDAGAIPKAGRSISYRKKEWRIGSHHWYEWYMDAQL